MTERRGDLTTCLVVGLVVLAGCSATAAEPLSPDPTRTDGQLSGPATEGTSTTGSLPELAAPIALSKRPMARELYRRARKDGVLSKHERATFTELNEIAIAYREDVARALLVRSTLTEELPLQLRLFQQVDHETKEAMLTVGLAGDYDRRVPPWLRVYIATRNGRDAVRATGWRINAVDAEFTTLNQLEEALWADGTLTTTDVEALVLLGRYMRERSTFRNQTWSRYDQVRAVIDLERELADGAIDPTVLDQLKDTDGDYLINRWERVRSGTDPTTAHTDTDAFTDAEEVFVLPTIVPASEHPSPTRPDVYVEVDYEAGLRPRLVGETALIEEFDTHGVTLHLIYDDELKEFTRIHNGRMTHIAHGNADYAGKGFFYAVVIKEETKLRNGREEVIGVASGSRFIAKYNIRAFAHELGHVLGLHPTDFPGIDTKQHEGYESIMKYEYGPIEYSDQPPFDDWAEMYDTGFNTSTAELHLRCSPAASC